MAQIDLKNATIKILDGTASQSGGPKAIEVKIGEGNLTFSEKRTIEYTLDRGNLDEVRLGDEVPVDVSIDATWEYIKGDDITTTNDIPQTNWLIDALKQINVCSDWLSTDADTCRPYAVDILVAYDPGACGGSTYDSKTMEIIRLPDFRWEQIDYSLRDGTFSITGKCNATQAITTRIESTTNYY